jgi:hypothetical protein
MHRMDRFGQYLAALDLEAQQREASLAFETVGFEAHSGIRFEQYQWALTQ